MNYLFDYTITINGKRTKELQITLEEVETKGLRGYLLDNEEITETDSVIVEQRTLAGKI
jgi:hypothetical protein